jgi:hypothetical protein
MSITPTTLSAIQQAGEAINTARQVLADAVTEHAQRVMGAIKHNPTHPDNDKSLEDWKALTQLAREVEQVEQQFRSIYFSAERLVMPEVQVLPSLGHQPKAVPPATPIAHDAQIQDVIAKPSGKKPQAGKRGSASRAPAPGLSTNDSKVLTHLTSVLTRTQWTRLTLQSIAQGAGIPNGSISIAMTRLVNAKQIKADGNSQYRLV